MKKIIVVLLIMSMMALTSNFIYAESTNNESLSKENCLNLKDVIQYNNNSNFGYTENLVSITPNETYTLVMSYDYIGDYMEAVLDSEFEFELQTNNEPFAYSYVDDSDQMLVYTEFVALEDFYIFYIPYLMNKDIANYEIMIYKGNYEDFEGFAPYVGYTFVRDMYAELELDYDALITTEEILSYIDVTNAQGEEISLVTLEDTFSISDKSPGIYQMTLYTVSNSLSKTLHLDIKIIDFTPPQILGENIVYVRYDNKPSIEEMISLYEVTDNVDQLTSQDIQIIDDGGYAENADIGTYEIVLSVEDSSGNKTNKTIAINIEDQAAPVILGPSNLTIYTTDDPYTSSYIIDQFKVSDDYDTDLEITIEEDNYLQNKTEGIYMMTLIAVDQSGNETKVEIKIHVIENAGPTIEINNPIIETTTDEQLSASDIDKYLKNELTQLNSKIKNVNIIYNEYDNHQEQPGSYYVYYDYELDDKIYESRILINVSEENNIFDYWYYIVASIGVAGTIFIAFKKIKK
ncbi:hypothetical protein KHQ89_08290 [Mycoplasmatota bacterium]|nr:hypothetical protein KHQ89_08290 [Mycoplasmatota bacterium]